MSGKLKFGVDYIYAMMEINLRSKIASPNAILLARLLLVSEWGLTVEEQNTAFKEFADAIERQMLDDFSIALHRLVSSFRDDYEAKSKLLLHLIMVTLLDGDVSDDEQTLVFFIGGELDFRRSEILALADRAGDTLGMLQWFMKNYEWEQT